jgi:hypothetical protein
MTLPEYAPFLIKDFFGHEARRGGGGSRRSARREAGVRARDPAAGDGARGRAAVGWTRAAVSCVDVVVIVNRGVISARADIRMR